MKNEDDKKKLLVVGDVQSGKSYLLHKMNCDKLPEYFHPYYFGYGRGVLFRKTKVDGKKVLLALWDTSVDDERARVRSYPYTDVVLICFALDDPTSLENVRTIWHPEIKREIPNVKYLLIGTKVDLRNENTSSEKMFVTYNQGVEMSKIINAEGYFECSVKNGIGIKEIRNESARIASGLNKKQYSEKICNIL